MLRPSSLACRLVPSGLRTFSKGWGLLSRDSAAHGTLLDTGGAAALWEKSHGPRRVLGQTKEGLDLLAQRREKDPTDCVHGGGAEGPSKATANPGRRGQGEAVACWGATSEARTARQWGFDGGLWTEADGVRPFQGSVESRWALLPES